MSMWLMIMYVTLAVTGASLLYLSNRVCKFYTIRRLFGEKKKAKAAFGVFLVFGLFILTGLMLNFMNAIVCAVYFAMIWFVTEILCVVITKVIHFYLQRKGIKIAPKPQIYSEGLAAIFYSVVALVFGWNYAHHVVKTEYTFQTDKISRDMRIIGFADAHIGTTFHADGFAEHINEMQKQNPDIVVIAGDFVDDETTKEDMIASCKALKNLKTRNGVYFVFGNHDKGYYGAAHRGFSEYELIEELQKNDVKVLRDDTELVDDMMYIVGRRDYSVTRERRGVRQSMSELTANLDRDKFIFVLDHQPADYQNQADAMVDLVFSGHTHGGQLFPFNQVGKWIGANDLVYGHEKRKKTDFVVTSGISDWAIKFKTGTKSEYVVLNLLANKE